MLIYSLMIWRLWWAASSIPYFIRANISIHIIFISDQKSSLKYRTVKPKSLMVFLLKWDILISIFNYVKQLFYLVYIFLKKTSYLYTIFKIDFFTYYKRTTSWWKRVKMLVGLFDATSLHLCKVHNKWN